MCEPFEKIYTGHIDKDGWWEEDDRVVRHCGISATQWECQLPEQNKILRGWVCSATFCMEILGTQHTAYQNWPIKEVV